MKKYKSTVVSITIALIALGSGFYGGIQYQKMQRPTFNRGNMGANGQFNGTRPSGLNGGNIGGGRPVMGEIVKIEDNTLTVQGINGNKLVVLSEKTQVNKTTLGNKDDLKEGDKITVIGTDNNNTISAQMIMITNMNQPINN